MRTSLYAKLGLIWSNFDLKANFPCVIVFNLQFLNLLIRIYGLTNVGPQFTLLGSLLYSGFAI